MTQALRVPEGVDITMTRQPGTDTKPTPADLGIDLAMVEWTRSGTDAGSIEIAIPAGPPGPPGPETGPPGPETGPPGTARWARGDWVLMRVAGDPAARVLVFDRNEWTCFIDGARNGEFDNAVDP